MLTIRLFCLLLIGTLLADLSGAHAKLTSSSPSNGAQVMEAPKTLTLTFNEEVKLANLTLTLAGKNISVPIDKSAPAAKTVVVPISALAAGVYEIHWTAISTDDGHVTKGSFAFTVTGPLPGH